MSDRNTTPPPASPPPPPERRPRILRRAWSWWWSPSAVLSLGFLLILGFVAGIVFWGGFNTGMEMTNTQKFCVTCHEMNDNVGAEFTDTIHQVNASGVRAQCSDCHVPKDWTHKMVRKVKASRELYHHLMGKIKTVEDFEAHRIELASNVWRTMKATDSRECRNCHKFDYMDFTQQENRAAASHQAAIDQGKTCIDCHQGIAHRLPADYLETYREVTKDIPDNPVSGAAQQDASAAVRDYLAHSGG